ncbi:hypothetical protein F3X92_25205 [Salmonella enterica]|nr:hypothetical protein [Salmonella enterica]
MNATTKAGEERLRGRQNKMRTENTKVTDSRHARLTTAAAYIGGSALLWASLSASNCTLGAPIDIGNIPYGTYNEQVMTLRIFYVIVPSTQNNQVAVGSMVIPYWLKNGYAKPKVTHPSVAAPKYSNLILGHCDRTARNKCSWDTINGLLSNAQLCTNALVGYTQFSKIGSGHAVTKTQQIALSRQIIDDINKTEYVKAKAITFTTKQWAPPGAYTQSIKIDQPGNSQAVYSLGGDSDYDAAYCLYDIYPGYSG